MCTENRRQSGMVNVFPMPPTCSGSISSRTQHDHNAGRERPCGEKNDPAGRPVPDKERTCTDNSAENSVVDALWLILSAVQRTTRSRHQENGRFPGVCLCFQARECPRQRSAAPSVAVPMHPLVRHGYRRAERQSATEVVVFWQSIRHALFSARMSLSYTLRGLAPAAARPAAKNEEQS